MDHHIYTIFENKDGSFHILIMNDNGSGYIICDKIESVEDAEFIKSALELHKTHKSN